MSDPASQKNSPYILLALLSILVVTTLVVASLYFVGPNIRTASETTVTEEVQKVGKLGDIPSTLTDTLPPKITASETKELKKNGVENVLVEKTENKDTKPVKAEETSPPKKDSTEQVKKAKIVEVKAEIKPETQPGTKPKDECDVRFTGNKLLVKNIN